MNTVRDSIDFISAHHYSENRRGDSAWFLAEGLEIDRVLDDYAALLSYVRAVKKSDRHVKLSFDEWNVWYKGDVTDGGWSRAPHLVEEIFNLEDALVCAQYLTSFLRHADTVKIACLAQIVNVIAPILTRSDGILLQAPYYPFLWFAQHARGLSLLPMITSPTYRAGDRGDAPTLDAAVTYDQSTERVAIFLVNRSQHDAIQVRVDIADRSVLRVVGADVLSGVDVKAANSWDDRKCVAPYYL